MIANRKRNLGSALHSFGLIQVALILPLIWLSWKALPEQVPIHFDWALRADRWGPKAWTFMIPALLLPFFFGLTWLERRIETFRTISVPPGVDPHNPAVRRELRQMISWLKFLVTTLFVGLTILQIRAALGESTTWPRLRVALCAAGVLVVMIVYHFRVRRPSL